MIRRFAAAATAAAMLAVALLSSALPALAYQPGAVIGSGSGMSATVPMASGAVLVGQGATLDPQVQAVPALNAGAVQTTNAIHPSGVIYGTTATAGTATGTSEQILATFSLPANALDQVGRRVRIRAMFSKAANTDTVTGKVYFGSEAISSGANAVSGAGMVLELVAVKTGSSTQIVWGQGYQGTTLVTPYSAAGAETDSTAITIKATCTDGTSAANDCVLQDVQVEYLN